MNLCPENGNRPADDPGGGDGWNLSTDRIKTFPLPDSHLNSAAVLACSIIDHQEATGELREELLMLRQIVSDLRELIRWVLYEASDLLTRQDTALQMAVAAREHPGFKVPEWFFQQESSYLRAMVSRRAKYLKSAKLDIDGAWDLLREFCESCHQIIADSDLAAIIEEVYAGKAGR